MEELAETFPENPVNICVIEALTELTVLLFFVEWEMTADIGEGSDLFLLRLGVDSDIFTSSVTVADGTTVW